MMIIQKARLSQRWHVYFVNVVGGKWTWQATFRDDNEAREWAFKEGRVLSDGASTLSRPHHPSEGE
jgi:hypothetical protein